jgi:Protein of unknown function (DUF1573)
MYFQFSFAQKKDSEKQKLADSVAKISVPAMTILEKTHTFGEVKQGQRLSYVFQFVNSSQQPAQILAIQSSCHCSMLNWDKHLMLPQEFGKIYVQIDTKKIPLGVFRKSFVLISPQGETLFYLTGKIIL